MRRRLHVKVSRECNNNCVFCLDDRARRHDVDDGEVDDLLARHRHLGEVLFTCGEPTLHPSLPRFVHRARRTGYRSIGLVTNGRRLSYPAYSQSLLDAGLTEVTVSIHGHDRRSHDALTRAPGAFEQTRAALENLSRLRRGTPLRLITSTVLCDLNADGLRPTLEGLGRLGVDVMVVNVVEPSGQALRHLDLLSTSYRDLARSVAEALDGFEGRERVAVEGLPLCLCHPFLDRVGIREEIHLRQGDRIAALPPDRNHRKPGICEGCSLTGRCPGVFEAYAERRGTQEIARVT